MLLGVSRVNEEAGVDLLERFFDLVCERSFATNARIICSGHNFK